LICWKSVSSFENQVFGLSSACERALSPSELAFARTQVDPEDAKYGDTSVEYHDLAKEIYNASEITRIPINAKASQKNIEVPNIMHMPDVLPPNNFPDTNIAIPYTFPTSPALDEAGL
jgi:hypothetical protein